MSWTRLGRVLRVIRLRNGMRQADVAASAGVSRSTVSLLELGHAARLAVSTVEAVIGAVGARLDPRISWNGPELDRLMDAGHAALSASIKQRLERWGWQVRVEVSFNRYGERGRIDLLAWDPSAFVLLVIEVKSDLIDVQALLGSMDVRERLARYVTAQFGWQVRHVVPGIVFMEDRTTRRRLEALIGLFDRYELRGRAAVGWLRRPRGIPAPRGFLCFWTVPNARVVRISGQRIRGRRKPGPT